MRRLKTRIPILLAFSAQLTTVWLALAPGLVVCMEEDGRVAVEASAGGDVCGDATPSQGDHAHSLILAGPVSGHCVGCLDVPLFLAGDVAAEHQHATAISSTDAGTSSNDFAPMASLTYRPPVAASSRFIARIPSQRSTVLRI